MNVGVKELRDGLSRHLALVRWGAEITVTDHGKPVARLLPYDAESGLEQLIAPALARAVRSRAEHAGASVSRVLTDLVEAGLEHSSTTRTRLRNGFPVMSSTTGHVVTDELVAEHLDQW